jgi:hypothetical protein
MMTDDMDLAGDVIQALAQFLNIDDLMSTADFPMEIETLKQILIKVGPQDRCLNERNLYNKDLPPFLT